MNNYFKIISYRYLFIILGFVSCESQIKSAGIKPNVLKPKCGEKVTFDYSPPYSISLPENCAASIIFSDGHSVSQQTVPLNRLRDGFSFEFKVPDSTASALICIVDAGNALIDNNMNNGYLQSFYTPQGTRHKKFALSNANLLISRWFTSIFKCNVTRKDVIELFNIAYERNPNLKDSNHDQYLEFLWLLHLEKGDSASSLLRNHAEYLRTNLNNEKKLIHSSNIFGWLNMSETQRSVDSIILNLFPTGIMYGQMFEQDSVISEDGSKEELKLKLEGIARRFNHEIQPSLFEKMLPALKNIGDTVLIKNFESMVLAKKELIPIYESFAENIVSDLESSNEDLTMAGFAATRGRYVYSNSINYPDSSIYWSSISLYSKILYRLGDYETFSWYQGLLLDGHNLDTKDIEDYAKMIQENKGDETAKNFIEKQLAYPVYSIPLLNQLRGIYQKSEPDLEKYHVFTKTYHQMIRNKLRDQLLLSFGTSKAPNFKLLNLDSAEVNLTDFQGKVVILDFWATWCGPCKSAFPYMKELKEKYESRDDVKFLFIDVREFKSPDIVRTQIREYISTKGYTDFDIPIDVNNKVADDYGITLLPTKFIIDRNGHLAVRSQKGTKEDLEFELNLVLNN